MSYNIATMPQKEQDAIQHDLMASFWAYKEKRGLMSRPEIIKYIHQHFLEADLQQHLMDRYEYFKSV